MVCLSLSLLGAFQATLDGEPVTGFGSAKVRALLAYLATESNRPHRRETLAALFWPEQPERVARSNLRLALSSLRKAIGDRDAGSPYLLVTRETVQFDCASDCWLDVQAFRTMIEADPADPSASRQLDQALSLYRGDFLEGFSVRDSPAFEDWALLMRERLHRQASTALQRLVEENESCGNHDRACEYAWRWVELAPWQEEAHQQLMRILVLSGQRTTALAQYEACRRALKEELDVEPGKETTQLYEDIRDGVFASTEQARGQEARSVLSGPRGAPSSLQEPLRTTVGRQAAVDIGLEANLAGRNLGAYRIIEQIGRGGMATVYKAYEPALDRHVAIKVLHQHLVHDPDFTTRFEREAKAVAKLDHPNILPIYSYGQEAGLNYISMRYVVEARTLKELLKQPLNLRTATDILRQIGQALDYAHQQGIVHRDVKPANVLVVEGKRALLSDFSLAWMIESSVQLNKGDVGMGTPAYMSPEQGLGLKVDARSDVYSLGVVLYETVTGRVPYDAETPMAVVLKHISAPLPLPRGVNPLLPEPIEQVILKALAKDPADRYQTAGEVVKALERVVAGMPVVEWPPEAPSAVVFEPALAPPAAPVEAPVAAKKGLPG